MPKIEVLQTSIIINDYNLGDYPTLEKNFKIFDPIRFVEEYKGLVYEEENKRLILPRGIDVGYLERTFNSIPSMNFNKDPIGKINDVYIKYLPRDDRQKEALKFILGEGEYFKNKQKSQLSVNLNTGAGKTYVSIMTIAYLCLKSMIIMGSVSWIDQWKERIMEYTDIKSNEIYIISGHASIVHLLKSDKDKYKIFLASHNTIKSYGDNYGWNKVSELFKYLEIAIKIYDEAHLNFDNMVNIDYYTNSYKTLYVTATPARSDRRENNIFKLYFKNIPSIDLFDEDKDPRTSYIALRFNSRPSAIDISSCKNAYGLNRNGYADFISTNENFRKIIRIVLDMTIRLEGKILIYVGTNKAINNIVSWIIENYPEYEQFIGIYTSVVKENKELALDKKFIFSTTKSCGAAMDIKGLKATVVLAEPFKSEVLARQTLGRTRDKGTYYIDIVDDGFIELKRYYHYKKNIFSRYAVKCSEVYLDNKELELKNMEIMSKRFKGELVRAVRIGD